LNKVIYADAYLGQSAVA